MIRCPRSGTAGARVPRITLKALLTSDALRRLGGADYFFCAAPDCDVVYFDARGGSFFLKGDLTVRVGLKEREDPIPVCYCFAFLESQLRDDLVRRGISDIPREIAREVREGRCACEVRNPEGVCCLGRVSQILKQLRAELPVEKARSSTRRAGISSEPRPGAIPSGTCRGSAGSRRSPRSGSFSS